MWAEPGLQPISYSVCAPGVSPAFAAAVRPVLDDGSDVGPERRHGGGHALHAGQLHAVHAGVQPEDQGGLRRETPSEDL